MSRFFRLFAFAALSHFAVNVVAQGAPPAAVRHWPNEDLTRFELFAGYGLLYEGITPQMGLGGLSAVTNSGFTTSFSGNISRHAALVGDFTGSYSSNSAQRDHHFYTAMVGPRFRIMPTRPFVPWAQFLIGAAQNNWSQVTTSNAYQVALLANELNIPHNLVNASLATRISGGIDLPVFKLFASRTELGWLHTRGLAAGTNSSGQCTSVQFTEGANHMTFSTGLLVKF
jgi:hypothetical protein